MDSRGKLRAGVLRRTWESNRGRWGWGFGETGKPVKGEVETGCRAGRGASKATT